MVLFGYGVIPNTFGYKLSGFSGERQENPQIGDSCGNYELFTATGGQTPPFGDIFSTPIEESVTYFVIVSDTNPFKYLPW